MDLYFLFHSLLKRKWWLIATPIASATLAFFLSFNLAKEYKSVGQLSLGLVQNNTVSLNDNNRVLNFEVITQANNAIETLYSPNILDLLTYRMITHDLGEEDPFRLKNLKESEKPISEESLKEIYKYAVDKLQKIEIKQYDTYRQDSTFNEIVNLMGYDYNSLRESLTLKKISYSDYINVYFSSESPTLSAFAVNEFCDLAIKYNESQRSIKTRESLTIISNVLQEKRKAYEEKSAQLESIKKSRDILNLDLENEENAVKTISDLKHKRDELINNNQILEIKLSNLRRKINDNTSGTSSQDRSLISLKKQINTLNARLVRGDDSVKDSLEYLKERYKALEQLDNLTNIDEAISELELEGIANKIKLESIENNINELRNKASNYISKDIKTSSLQHEVNMARDEYLNTEKRYNIELSKNLITQSNIQQTNYAYPPSKPEPSKKMLFLLFSAFGSLGIVLFSMVTYDFLDMSIKLPTRLSTSIPFKYITSFVEVNSKHIPDSPTANSKMSEKNNIQLVDSSRKIRLEIDKSESQTVLVSSLKNKAGKTFTVNSLTNSFNLKGKKVLVIDLNLKNNTLTDYYNAKPSIADIKTSDSNSYLQNLITKTDNVLVDIVGCEKSQKSPLEITDTNQWNEFLSWAKSQYDIILIETAALEKYSDAEELVPLCDKVILVFSANETLTEMSTNRLNSLNESYKSKILGAVLNKVHRSFLNL
ncbi:Wzz/FepE/Etk N-terminal domain-containing protein [Limibacter armeniacum]|uniref:GumC family protein n=1 Tax=Limibacter armeniacum TaxID=466084 RepID=UPI002FE689CC